MIIGNAISPYAMRHTKKTVQPRAAEQTPTAIVPEAVAPSAPQKDRTWFVGVMTWFKHLINKIIQ